MWYYVPHHWLLAQLLARDELCRTALPPDLHDQDYAN